MSDDMRTSYELFHKTVNMSVEELESWMHESLSLKNSSSRGSIVRTIGLLQKKESDWTILDVDHAERICSFIWKNKHSPKGVLNKTGIMLKNRGYDVTKK